MDRLISQKTIQDILDRSEQAVFQQLYLNTLQLEQAENMSQVHKAQQESGLLILHHLHQGEVYSANILGRLASLEHVLEAFILATSIGWSLLQLVAIVITVSMVSVTLSSFSGIEQWKTAGGIVLFGCKPSLRFSILWFLLR